MSIFGSLIKSMASKASKMSHYSDVDFESEGPIDYEVTSCILLYYLLFVYARRGRRKTQQDRICISEDKRFLVVLDGHGDKDYVVDYCSDNILKYHKAHFEKHGRRETAATQTIKQLNREVKKQKIKYGGTVLVALSMTDSEIIVHNLGDCRAVLGSNKEAIDLSEDHKPDLPAEKQRIIRSGGKITFDNYIYSPSTPSQVNFSRCIGDLELSKHLSRIPAITLRPRDKETDDFIVLASDGLWGPLSSARVVKHIYDMRESGSSKEEITAKLANLATIMHYDNVSVIIVWFN